MKHSKVSLLSSEMPVGKRVFVNKLFAPGNSKDTRWLGSPTTIQGKSLNYLFKATPSVQFQP